MAGVDGVSRLGWCSRHKVSAGFNWYPIRQVIIKGEYTCGLLKSTYNNEPAVSLGVAYVGWFM
ncbi:MAG: hypothetical protein K2I91_05540 [Muribaculaceae bacterium]|nr:hypothetical protein [Muribaculaceae bacterium]